MASKQEVSQHQQYYVTLLSIFLNITTEDIRTQKTIVITSIAVAITIPIGIIASIDRDILKKELLASAVVALLLGFGFFFLCKTLRHFYLIREDRKELVGRVHIRGAIAAFKGGHIDLAVKRLHEAIENYEEILEYNYKNQKYPLIISILLFLSCIPIFYFMIILKEILA